MQLYHKLWKKIIIHYENIPNNLLVSFEEKNNQIYIFSSSKHLSFLINNKEKLEIDFKNYLHPNISVFIKTYLEKSFFELQTIHENFLNKFSNIDIVLHSKNKDIYDKLLNIFNKKTKNISLIGIHGNGKTSIVYKLISSREWQSTITKAEILYLDCFYLSKIYYEFIEDKEDEDDFWNLFDKLKLIIFDDIPLAGNNKKANELIARFLNRDNKNECKSVLIFDCKYNDINKIDIILQNIINKSLCLKLETPNKKDISLIIDRFLIKYNSNLKITQEGLDYLSLFLGNNIKNAINKLIQILMLFYNPSTLKILNLHNIKKAEQQIYANYKDKKSVDYEDNYYLKTICENLNIPVSSIRGNSRKKNIVMSRNIIIYILKKELKFSHNYIGKILNKHHTSITYSLKLIEKKIEDKSFKDYLNTLLLKIF